ncbi:MAG: transketolase C-terminal domain-containing protein, partial [Candidatus Peribacteraceae bacterium]|nr:transketolase C-terminal domain-containing protein [Candidatus Peribacteraceae bacterium]
LPSPMTSKRPDASALTGQDAKVVPFSCRRVLSHPPQGEHLWIGPKDGKPLTTDERQAYDLAHTILKHLIVSAPLKHKSGHPGGPLSAFTFSYLLSVRRDPARDQPMRMSAGHLSLLSFGLQWLFGREGSDKRLASPQAIIDTFRTPDGLPGHIEAGIGDIPFGTGPLGKGVSNALGVAFGLKLQKKPGIVDVLLADGDAQEGQVMEAFRLASHLKLDHLVVHGDFNDVQLSGLPSQTVAADFASIAHACDWHVIEVQNGNDPMQVRAALDAADALVGKGRPIFICYYTTMGYGIPFMEEGSNTGQKNYHGAPLSAEEAKLALDMLPDLAETMQAYEPFRTKEKKRFAATKHTETDIPLTLQIKGYERAVTLEKGAARQDFGAVHIRNLMKADSRIIVLHADLAGSGGFTGVAKDFPDRVINVGVAEANMAMMAAGLRQSGLLPITYTFAAFGVNEARANSRLIDINCGHTRCAVLHDCTHAGLSVGEDGETHQEQNYFTLPFRHTQVWMPADSNQAAAMAERGLELIAEGHTSVYVFSPRTGHEQLKDAKGGALYDKNYRFSGRADRVRGKGDLHDRATIITTGIGVHNAIAAADVLAAGQEKLSVRVLAIGCIRPLDATAILEAALETGHLIVVEDHNTEGGLASQVADVLADFSLPCTFRRLGLMHYFPSATAKELEFMAGLDAESIQNAILDDLKAEVRGSEDALVTSLFEIVHNARFSRWRSSIVPYVKRLIDEKEYIETLRVHWAKRACPPAKLPKTEELRKKLSEFMGE